MSRKRERVIGIAGAILLPTLCAASFNSAIAAPPRAASATVTRTGPAGNSSVRQTNVTTNGRGGYTANSTVTGPAGNSAIRQTVGSYNPATKTYTRSSTTTGSNGNQWNSNASVQAMGNGVIRTATHAGPNGNSVTSTGQASYDPATGTATQTRRTTASNGQSVTEGRTVTGTANTTPSN